MELSAASLFPFLMSLLVVLLTTTLTLAWRLFYTIVWKTQKIEKSLAKQGVKGPPRANFVDGNRKELAQMDKEARSKPIENPCSHDLIPRVMPAFNKFSKQYGNVYVDWNGLEARLFVNDADMVKEIVYNKTDDFPKAKVRPALDVLLGKGLVFVNGGQWTRHRKVVTPAFHTDKLKGMTNLMIECADSKLKSWGSATNKQQQQQISRRELEIHEELMSLTSDIIARTAFGSSYKEGKEVFAAQIQMLRLTVDTTFDLFIPGTQNLPTPTTRRLRELEKTANDTLRSIINSRINAVNDGGSFGDDLLGVMLESSRAEENKEQKASSGKVNLTLSMEEIIHECQTFFFAGEDTTSNLLTWSTYLLCVYPEWQEKVREEVMSVYGTKTPDYDAHAKLKLVGMVLNETLRLYPPVVEIFRVAARDAKLGNLIIPKDTTLRIPILPIQRKKEYWGEDADEFNPLRFSEGFSRAAKHPNAMLPFSAGSRNCVGQNFAMIEARLVLSMMLQRFRFSLSPNYKHAPVQNITLQPQFGVQVIVETL